MPEDPDDRLAHIETDLAYYKEVLARQDSRPLSAELPMVSAHKYVRNIEYLLKCLGRQSPVVSAPKSDLELALEHDAAGRVERSSRS